MTTKRYAICCVCYLHSIHHRTWLFMSICYTKRDSEIPFKMNGFTHINILQTDLRKENTNVQCR